MRRFLPILLLLILSGCQTIYSRGQYVDDSQVDSLMKTRMTKEEVVEMLGSPTIVPDYTENTWYYAQRSLGYRAFFAPKIISQRIVKIDFVKNTTDKVEVFNNTHTHDILVTEEYTKSPGTERNPIQSFVRNFGKFNKSKKTKKKTRH